jgi:uncharacterized protein YecT (DUF1311 family)
MALLAVSLPGHAAAQDCSRVTRFPDRLICADATARAADAAMGDAYRALRARSDVPTRARLQAAQRRWLALRARACAGFYDHEDADRVRCLVDMSGARRAALASGRVEGEIIAGTPGEPSGRPPLIAQTEALGDPRRNCAVNIRTPRLEGSGPEAAAFNQAIRRAADDPLFVSYGSGFARYRGCPPRTHAFPHYDYNLDFAVTLRTERVIAVQFVLYYDSGNSHPLGIARSVIVDLARRRALAIADLIEPAGIPVAEAACRRSLLEEEGDSTAALIEEQFAAIVRTDAAWSIAPGAVQINFPPGTILPGPPREVDCAIPLDTLRPYLAAGSPLR